MESKDFINLLKNHDIDFVNNLLHKITFKLNNLNDILEDYNNQIDRLNKEIKELKNIQKSYEKNYLQVNILYDLTKKYIKENEKELEE